MVAKSNLGDCPYVCVGRRITQRESPPATDYVCTVNNNSDFIIQLNQTATKNLQFQDPI